MAEDAQMYEDLYLDLYERFALDRDQLGETLEAERRSDFSQQAEWALAFFFGGIASGMLAKLGEDLAEHGKVKLQALVLFCAKGRHGRADPSPCIDALPAIVETLPRLPPEALRELETASVASLTSQGYSKETAVDLTNRAFRDLRDHRRVM